MKSERAMTSQRCAVNAKPPPLWVPKSRAICQISGSASSTEPMWKHLTSHVTLAYQHGHEHICLQAHAREGGV